MTKQEKEVNKILKKVERVKLKAEKIKNKEFGTYIIKTINEKGENGYYVGSSVDIQQRLKEHKRTFKIKYPNEKMVDFGTTYGIPYEIRTKYPDFNRRGYLIVLESQTWASLYCSGERMVNKCPWLRLTNINFHYSKKK